MHDKPDTRATWAPHGTHGYYLGPAQAHYRCYRVWATATKSIRITDTIAWFLQGLQIPGPSAHDLLRAAITDLTQAVRLFYESPISDTPLHPTGLVLNTLTDALQQLSDMYPLKNTRNAPSFETAALIPATADRVLIPTLEQRVIPDLEQRVIPCPKQRVQDIPVVECLTSLQQHEANTTTILPTLRKIPVSSSADIHTSIMQPLLKVPPEPVQQTPTPLVSTPNTLITAQYRPRQHHARPPLPTDRVTRLNGQKQHTGPCALQTSVTLNLENFGRPLNYRSAKNGPNTLQ